MEKNKRTAAILGFGVIAALLLFGYVYTSGDSDRETIKGETGAEGSADIINFEKTNMSNPIVTLKTTMGDIVFEMYIDKTPITAGNFILLAKEGFYDGTKFHRVIGNFMIQGGDPNSRGNDTSLYGRGGPGYTIEDEFVPGLSNLRGTISMANIGQPNSGGSQFFINFTNNIGLDFDKQPETSKHTVFGNVVEGMEVVDAIAKVQVGERDIPLEPIIIVNIVVDEAGKGSGENQEEGEQNQAEAEEYAQNDTKTDKSVRSDKEETEVGYAFPEFDLGVVPLFNLWAFSEEPIFYQ